MFFLWFHVWKIIDPAFDHIVITPGQIETMNSRFKRTWQRLPTEQELQELKDGYVRGEIAAREVRVFDLDRDDTIIKRSLRQKLDL